MSVATVVRRVAASVVALGLAGGVAAPAGAAEIDDLRNAVASAQNAANAATARYMDAVNELEALEAEIANTGREIEVNREIAAALRVVARDRAVIAYKRRGIELGVLSLDHPLDSIRREKLLQETNARDNAAVGRLNAITEDLATRRTGVA